MPTYHLEQVGGYLATSGNASIAGSPYDCGATVCNGPNTNVLSTRAVQEIPAGVDLIEVEVSVGVAALVYYTGCSFVDLGQGPIGVCEGAYNPPNTASVLATCAMGDRLGVAPNGEIFDEFLTTGSPTWDGGSDGWPGVPLEQLLEWEEPDLANLEVNIQVQCAEAHGGLSVHWEMRVRCFAIAADPPPPAPEDGVLEFGGKAQGIVRRLTFRV